MTVGSSALTGLGVARVDKGVELDVEADEGADDDVGPSVGVSDALCSSVA